MHRKVIFFALLLFSAQARAQFSRMHIKPPSSSTLGVTIGMSPSRVLGLTHDGMAGLISTTTLDGSSDSSPLKFYTAGAPRLTIYGNGFVGIGTTSAPTAELTVAGKIHAREVKVNVTAGTGPDYVFSDSFRLRSLHEVSFYINQHRHLPEVPPAVVMETEGVNVSEMNMILLKKIEELTLYLIEQDKKQAMLSAEIEKLKAELAALK